MWRGTSEMAKLGMRVCSKLFCILDHVLDCAIGPASSSVIHVDRLKLNVEGGEIASIEADNVLSDEVDLLVGDVLSSFSFHSLLNGRNRLNGHASFAACGLRGDIFLHVLLEHIEPLK